jgi:hypothetical protein
MSPQQKKVLSMLQAGPRCGKDFLDVYIARYSARILELKQLGYLIDKRPCRFSHHDHEAPMFVWELATSDQMSLL